MKYLLALYLCINTCTYVKYKYIYNSYMFCDRQIGRGGRLSKEFGWALRPHGVHCDRIFNHKLINSQKESNRQELIRICAVPVEFIYSVVTRNNIMSRNPNASDNFQVSETAVDRPVIHHVGVQCSKAVWLSETMAMFRLRTFASQTIVTAANFANTSA